MPMASSTDLPRVLREAQASARLTHRNITTLYDADQESGVFFITMELLEGTPLNKILESRGRLSSLDTARIAGQICAHRGPAGITVCGEIGAR